MRFRAALLLPLVVAACATALPRADDARGSTTHVTAAHPPVDPTVRDVRFVPASLREERVVGADPGGGVRSIEDGIRVLSLPGGAVLTSADRLPMAIESPMAIALPERLGGGFLFIVDGTHVWRADSWLEPARPIFTSRTSFLDTYGRVTGGLSSGLDRVYVYTGTGARSWQAIDGVTGKDMPLGPWPASPSVSAYAAVDGWRAIAIADLRGAVVTLDAGATWRAIRLPFDARDAHAVGETFELVGIDPSGSEVRYDVSADLQAVGAPDVRTSAAESAGSSLREPTSPLGASPLTAAVEDGWPLGDGTAIVARDGALARVRLDDGTIVELATDAYGLRPSRCHPFALGAPAGVGFVCGESRGATVLYAFDPSQGRMDEVRRFDSPRAVLPSGSGAVAVRGPCDAASPAESSARDYCVRSREGQWRDIRLEGNVGAERVVALADSRVVILSPPEGNIAAARVTILDGERARSVPMVFEKVSLDEKRVLDVGVWLDGFEERRPGVVGGWIEAAGTMLGVEIDLDGRARLGQYVRDAGRTMVSGRYGLGWTTSLLGLETTDGGMTWTQLDVPAPIASGRAVTSRACGPIGCNAAGWLKIGWGRGRRDLLEAPPPRPSTRRTALALAFDCELVPSGTRRAAADPFAAFPAPATTADETLIPNETLSALVYAWGPKVGEWDRVAKWTVRWAWPFGGSLDARTTIPSPAPSLVSSAARLGAVRTLRWSLLAGDDGSHALLTTHRKRDETSVFELEADHAPMEIARADGEPFGDVDAAVRVGGRWYLATAPRTGERMEATVWEVEGPSARPLARVPRSSDRAHASLAWRTDGRSVGLVVTGAPQSWPTRWVIPIDLESGGLGDVEPLGAQDLGDRAALPICTTDDAGWTLDIPVLVPVRMSTDVGAEPVTLGSPLARVRVSGARACVERLAGTLDPAPTTERSEGHTMPTSASLSVAVATSSGHERRSLRCSER
jgi:hypothetical protein